MDEAAVQVLEGFGDAFSVDNSAALFGFAPDLAATAEDCLQGVEETLAGLDLAETPFTEAGFVVFFLDASPTALSFPEDFVPSFLGEAGFLTGVPSFETKPKLNVGTKH